MKYVLFFHLNLPDKKVMPDSKGRLQPNLLARMPMYSIGSMSAAVRSGAMKVTWLAI